MIAMLVYDVKGTGIDTLAGGVVARFVVNWYQSNSNSRQRQILPTWMISSSSEVPFFFFARE